MLRDGPDWPRSGQSSARFPTLAASDNWSLRPEAIGPKVG